MEPAYSGAVVFSVSCAIDATSHAKSYVNVSLNGDENSHENKERKEHVISDSALKIAAYLGSCVLKFPNQDDNKCMLTAVTMGLYPTMAGF